MPDMREGAQSAAPPFYSNPSKPITDQARIEEILGSQAFDEAFFAAGEALFGRQDTYTLYASLIFNSQDRAILIFWDTLDQPDDKHPDRPEPRNVRKKFPDDAGALFQRASAIMKWS